MERVKLQFTFKFEENGVEDNVILERTFVDMEIFDQVDMFKTFLRAQTFHDQLIVEAFREIADEMELENEKEES